MKKLGLFIICILMPLYTACAKQDEAQSLFAATTIDLSPSPDQTNEHRAAPEGIHGLEAASSEEPEVNYDPAAAPVPAITVTDTIAYVFSGTRGATLYGAAAYQNTGNCPVTLTGASFSFAVNGSSVQHDFVPIMNDIAVVMPGETSFVTFWHADGSLTPGASAELSASLSWQSAEASRITITPHNLYLAANYPGFTTMTGSLSADGKCGLNLIYTGFYDASGDLLGVWHFTRNVALDQGESKAFTVHMKELPIEGLAEDTAEIRTYGVGF